MILSLHPKNRTTEKGRTPVIKKESNKIALIKQFKMNLVIMAS